MTAPVEAPRSPRRALARAAALAGVLLAAGWSLRAIELDAERLLDALPRMAEFLGRMVPPDMSVAETVVRATLETVQIAFLGTLIAILASIPLAVLAASNLTSPIVHAPIKGVLAAIRAVPLILMALFFVATVGLGALPGVLAVALHSTGMLAKFYAEALEEADAGPIEALDSAGAGWLQRVRYAVLPQVAPELLRDTLFRFELNFRESLILGLVGAGGIGLYIQLYIRAFQYDKVATLTLVVLVLVVAVEQASGVLRRRLR